MHNRHLCRSRQPFTTVIQCTVGNAPDFDTLGPWSGIKLLHFLLVHKLFIPSSNLARGIFFRFISTLFVMRVRERRRRDCMQHMRAPKARLYETHPSLHDRAGTLASLLYMGTPQDKILWMNDGETATTFVVLS